MNYILVNIIIYCLDSLNLDESSLHMLQPNHEKDMFILLRGTVTRLE